MKGFKATNNGKCMNFLFEVGKTYEIKGKLEMCRNGFHFCRTIQDTFNYYDPFEYQSSLKYFEVEALGEIQEKGDKFCTSKIRIIREVPREEYKDILSFNENGELHREGGPALIRPDGIKCWYVNGELHREDGPAIECADGSKEWWINDKLHREDGPAVEFADGSKNWYVNGKLHREDGPAIEWYNGDKYWYINGERMTEEEFLKWADKNTP